mmetsp:Transcript_48971/g.83683  ORF Transcript_48971/g.83683 Transcript_48971/m.83683 type:complete len:85 (-) Transcript_48971:1123-1377(-)
MPNNGGAFSGRILTKINYCAHPMDFDMNSAAIFAMRASSAEVGCQQQSNSTPRSVWSKKNDVLGKPVEPALAESSPRQSVTAAQ